MPTTIHSLEHIALKLVLIIKGYYNIKTTRMPFASLVRKNPYDLLTGALTPETRGCLDKDGYFSVPEGLRFTEQSDTLWDDFRVHAGQADEIITGLSTVYAEHPREVKRTDETKCMLACARYIHQVVAAEYTSVHELDRALDKLQTTLFEFTAKLITAVHVSNSDKTHNTQRITIDATSFKVKGFRKAKGLNGTHGDLGASLMNSFFRELVNNSLLGRDAQQLGAETILIQNAIEACIKHTRRAIIQNNQHLAEDGPDAEQDVDAAVGVAADASAIRKLLDAQIAKTRELRLKNQQLREEIERLKQQRPSLVIPVFNARANGANLGALADLRRQAEAAIAARKAQAGAPPGGTKKKPS